MIERCTCNARGNNLTLTPLHPWPGRLSLSYFRLPGRFFVEVVVTNGRLPEIV